MTLSIIEKRWQVLAVVTYVATIILANWMTNTFGLVGIGFGLMVTAGTFAAGFALITRDWVQITNGRLVLLLAILGGAGLSAFVSTPALALASGIAFLASELVDTGVFTPLRERSLPAAVVTSSIVAAPVDTVLFLWIAGFPLTWQAIAGQVIVKTVLALIVAGGISVVSKRHKEQEHEAATL